MSNQKNKLHSNIGKSKQYIMENNKSSKQQNTHDIMKSFEYNELGIAAYKASKFHEAIDYFTKSIEYAETPFNYSYRASSFFYLRDFKKAIDDYNSEAILKGLSKMTKKTLIEMYNNLAFAHTELDELQPAVDYYTKVMELDSDGFHGENAATKRKFLKAIIIRNSGKQDFKIIGAKNSTVKKTNQEVMVLELSEIKHSDDLSESPIIKYVVAYGSDLAKKVITAIKHEEILTINPLEFEGFMGSAGRVVFYHNSVRV